MSSNRYPRDLIGYGASPPHANWPDNARIAVSFVINYEEGGESCILHGDDCSETLLAQAIGEAPVMAGRDVEAETIFEYGSRAGFWRLMRLFAKYEMPVTFYAVGMALERNPDGARAMIDAGHEIASHGYRWIEYQYAAEEREREDMRLTIEAQERVTGSRPVGFYAGRASANTRRLVVEEGGFSTILTRMPTTCPIGTPTSGVLIWSSPTRSNVMTGSSRPRPVSPRVRRTSNICETLSTCFTKKAKTPPR